MQRYTREELLRASGARSDELAELEARRLLVPNRPRGVFARREPFYTVAQLAVLRYLLRTRRAWKAARRAAVLEMTPGRRASREEGVHGPGDNHADSPQS